MFQVSAITSDGPKALYTQREHKTIVASVSAMVALQASRAPVLQRISDVALSLINSAAAQINLQVFSSYGHLFRMKVGSIGSR